MKRGIGNCLLISLVLAQTTSALDVSMRAGANGKWTGCVWQNGTCEAINNGTPFETEQFFLKNPNRVCDGKEFNERTETYELVKQTPDAVVVELPRGLLENLSEAPRVAIQDGSSNAYQAFSLKNGALFLNTNVYSSQKNGRFTIWSPPQNPDVARIVDVTNTLTRSFPNRSPRLPQNVNVFSILKSGENPNGFWIADSIVLFSTNKNDDPPACGLSKDQVALAHRYHELGNLYRIHEPYAHGATWAVSYLLAGGDKFPKTMCGRLERVLDDALKDSEAYDAFSVVNLVEEQEVDRFVRWNTAPLWMYIHEQMRQDGAPDFIEFINYVHEQHNAADRAAGRNTPRDALRPAGKKTIDDLARLYEALIQKKMGANSQHAIQDLRSMMQLFFKTPIGRIKSELKHRQRENGCSSEAESHVSNTVEKPRTGIETVSPEVARTLSGR